MPRRVRYPVSINTRYQYAPTYGRGGTSITLQGEPTKFEVLFDFELQRINGSVLRAVSYQPGTDVIIEILEFAGSERSALNYLDMHKSLFIKIEE